jgi:glycosyltransferase involved in cell wall biosynthesis
MARIAIDARDFAAGKGASRPLAGLLEWLPKVAPCHDFIAIVDPRATPSLDSRISTQAIGSSSRLLATRSGLDTAARAVNADLLYVIGEVAPQGGGVPYVLHMHEDPTLRYRLHLLTGTSPPGGWLRGSLWHVAAAKQMRRAIRDAAAVVVSSQATADRLAARWDTARDMQVVHLGADHLPGDDTVPPPGDKSYIFHLGSSDPRDNTTTVLNAYAAAARDSALPPLVIAGNLGGLRPRFDHQARHLQIHRHLEFLGFLDDADLVHAMAGAIVCVQPSLYEGFGFTPLEAMRLGVPVIAGDNPVERELLGDAAVLVPPGSAMVIADAMRRLISDHALRARLSDLAKQRARAYTWRRAAAATVEVLDDLIGTTQGPGPRLLAQRSR